MATSAKNPLRIITHGNNAFKSTELISQMEIPEENNLEEFEFFPFSDINLNNRSSPSIPNAEMSRLKEELYQGVEVSAILVLISLTETFSDGMRTMIQKLPHSKFYGYNQRNEKEWWKHVIIVFSMGAIEYEKDSQVKKSITRNGGIKQIVKQAGNRYICMSDSTEPGDLVQKLRDVMQPMKKKLIFGGTHLPGYHETGDSFIHCFNNGRAGGFSSEDIDQRFIIFGEKQSGKSSLGNLLLFAPVFSTYWTKPTGRAKGFPISEADISELIEDGNKDTYNSDESLRIQVVDQPESSNPKLYREYLANCISGIKCSDPVTFLIAIKFNSEPLSQDEFTKINDSSVILGNGGCDFYSNAIIVFTHADDFVNHSEDNLRKILEKKLQLEDHAFLKKLLKLVEQRYIFLNAMNLSMTNRNEALRKILRLNTLNPDQTFRDETEDIGRRFPQRIKGGEIIPEKLNFKGEKVYKIGGVKIVNDTPVSIIFKDMGRESKEDGDKDFYKYLERRGYDRYRDQPEYTCIVLKHGERDREVDIKSKEYLENENDNSQKDFVSIKKIQQDPEHAEFREDLIFANEIEEFFKTNNQLENVPKSNDQFEKVPKSDDQLGNVSKSEDQLEKTLKSNDIIEEDHKHESKIREVLEHDNQSNGGSVNDGNIANRIKELMATNDTPVEILSKETLREHEGEINENSFEFLEKIRDLEKDTNNEREYVCIVVKSEKSNCVIDTERQKDLKNKGKSKEAFQTEEKIKRELKSEIKGKAGMAKEDRNLVVNNKVANNGLMGLSQREKEKIPKGGNLSELKKRFNSLETSMNSLRMSPVAQTEG